MYQRILIAYDGSREAERALEEGVNLAKALGAHVIVATVAEPLPGYYGLAAAVAPEVPDDFRKEELKRLGAIQLKASELASVHGLTIETTLVESDEVSGILDAAMALEADLLVVGLRRHTQHIEWVGTVRRIANRSRCSILAVV